MNNRGTGRTFRLLLDALKAASEGKQVVYLSPNAQSNSYNFNLAKDITISITGILYRKGKSSMEIVFPNGGTICFKSYTSNSEYLRGKKSNLYVDHAVEMHIHTQQDRQCLDKWVMFTV